jgi:hypothetical protein
MASLSSLTIEALPTRLAIVRFPPAAGVPQLPLGGAFLSLTITPDEISIVCAEEEIPDGGAAVSSGWRALRVAGELDFSLIGVMAALTSTLSAARVSVFTLSTYNTDYLLVQADGFEGAVAALRAAGHTVNGA